MDICGGFAGSENKDQASVGWLEVAPCQAAEAHLISGNLDCELQPSNNLTTSPKFQHLNYFNIKFQRARKLRMEQQNMRKNKLASACK